METAAIFVSLSAPVCCCGRAWRDNSCVRVGVAVCEWVRVGGLEDCVFVVVLRHNNNISVISWE